MALCALRFEHDMTATLVSNWFQDNCSIDISRVYGILDAEATWIRKDNTPRSEAFMAVDIAMRYSYGKANNRRFYDASYMHPLVESLRQVLNRDNSYNICVLNRYTDRFQHLGWHADDSPEQDPSHPICVVSFGAARYIYTKPQGDKGSGDKFLLTPGSLFIMPPGMQETHYHKIPKHDQDCGGRISLTFRKLDSHIPID